MSSAEFDRAYLHGQVVDHQKTAQLLEYEIGSGQDVELKGFASEICRSYSSIFEPRRPSRRR